MNRIKSWWWGKRQAAEVNRPIPRHYSWYMTAYEKRMWADGWRVTYWVCPTCGAPRTGPMRYSVLGWATPDRTCEC